jgi:hypothetical protein
LTTIFVRVVITWLLLTCATGRTTDAMAAAPFVAHAAISEVFGPYDLVAADFNADGLVDFAVANVGGSRSMCSWGLANCSRGAATQVSRSRSSWTRLGFIDLVTGEPNDIAFHRANGPFSFEPPSVFEGPFMGFHGPVIPFRIVPTDINNDRVTDLLIADYNGYVYPFIGDTIAASSFE